MTSQLTHVSSEVLPSALTQAEAGKLESHALKLYGDAQRTTVQFAADLRRLQDGGAHFIRGYPNFGEYIERTFEGITAVNAQQISRQGHVLIVLEDHHRISLAGKGENLPGTTGVRALAVILKKYGEEAMLSVYDKAFSSGRKVIAESVAAATAELMAPVPGELGAGSEDAPTVDPDEEDEQDEQDTVSPKVRELIDHIQDLSWELPDTLAEVQEATERLKAELAGESSNDGKWLASGR